MKYIGNYLDKLWLLVIDMAPWLLLGFLIAGVLHVLFQEGKINQLLGKSNMKSVLRAALIGIPLPLCSCGVIPTGVSIYKNGASKGASISFLISTPQTGVDSIMVTYSLLGLPFAVVRPIVALVTGVFGGMIVNQGEAKESNSPKADTLPIADIKNKPKGLRSVGSIFHYAFFEFMEDIAKWLIIGLLLAALIAVFVPDDFFANYIHNDLLGMLILLAASVPLYVCATSSVPIAAVLMLKGISPGAALVFLMAGPATNAATISVIGKSMGRKTLLSYLATLIVGALLSGLLIDYVFPREWFISNLSHLHSSHNHGILPHWLNVVSGVIISGLLLNIFVQKGIRRFRKKTSINNKQKAMGEIKVFVRGMNCNHCKNNVENTLRTVEGIDSLVVDLESEMVSMHGTNIDLEKVKNLVESIGYTYGGEAN